MWLEILIYQFTGQFVTDCNKSRISVLPYGSLMLVKCLANGVSQCSAFRVAILRQESPDAAAMYSFINLFYMA